MNRIITLTTDFGLRDAYTAVMKGVILGISPDVRLIDVTHSINPQDVMEAAFVLKNVVPYYPEETIHLAVVDPGVGTDRQPVAFRHADQWFVGPDNGLFSLILNGHTPEELVVLDNPDYWLTPNPGNTFHGRDIFAPAAAHIASGKPLAVLGSSVDMLKPLYWALPIADQQGVQGWVVHVDHFGNCITNITRTLIEDHCSSRGVKCYVGSTIIASMNATYNTVPSGEPLILFDSNDLLEIAINTGNASEMLSIRKGSPVNIVFTEDC